MSAIAYIRNMDSLRGLRSSMQRAIAEGEAQVPATDMYLHAQLEELRSNERFFVGKVEDAKESLYAAQRSLSTCRSQVYYDDDGNAEEPDCSSEEDRENECRADLREAEANYARFRQIINKLVQAIERFQLPRLKFKNALQFQHEAGLSCLTQLINGAEDYASIPFAAIVSTQNSSAMAQVSEPSQTNHSADDRLNLHRKLKMIKSAGINLENAGDSIITSVAGKQYSKLRIENKKGVIYGKFIKMQGSDGTETFPEVVLQNAEMICRANDVKEIYGWSDWKDISFYRQSGYDTRMEIKNKGAEVYKRLESDFCHRQQQASQAFDDLDLLSNRKRIDTTVRVDPLNILHTADNPDADFWSQHNETEERYLELIRKLEDYYTYSEQGLDNDEIRQNDQEAAKAYDVFLLQPVDLIKRGEFYRVEGNGRHRVAAAQQYYLQTGKTVPIPAQITEYETGE